AGIDVVLDAGTPEVVRDAPGHADRGAGVVPDLLKIPQTRPTTPILVETRSAVAAVEDERASRAAPSLLSLDDSHQLRRVLRIHGYLHLVFGFVEFRAERERLVRFGVVPPFEPSGCSHPLRAEEQEEDHGGDV